ncbi:hypothetical protein DFH08DRAFT_1002596 [Mycena albidolilacea]|uniref:Uncharacterized protein n=1 Tax=Mycena albidolilacea TaxID=1033008 RepID=A0AAD7A1G8_9AGAR|nr:hypothetical protein DFH08DRAFT_1002596 [Mycena albidolilacea]
MARILLSLVSLPRVCQTLAGTPGSISALKCEFGHPRANISISFSVGIRTKPSFKTSPNIYSLRVADVISKKRNEEMSRVRTNQTNWASRRSQIPLWKRFQLCLGDLTDHMSMVHYRNDAPESFYGYRTGTVQVSCQQVRFAKRGKSKVKYRKVSPAKSNRRSKFNIDAAASAASTAAAAAQQSLVNSAPPNPFRTLADPAVIGEQAFLQTKVRLETEAGLDTSAAQSALDAFLQSEEFGSEIPGATSTGISGVATTFAPAAATAVAAVDSGITSGAFDKGARFGTTGPFGVATTAL